MGEAARLLQTRGETVGEGPQPPWGRTAALPMYLSQFSPGGEKRPSSVPGLSYKSTKGRDQEKIVTLKQAYPADCCRVQCAFKVSMSHGSAIHITYRISLRSSSMQEPRDPLLKVVFDFLKVTRTIKGIESSLQRPFPGEKGPVHKR